LAVFSLLQVGSLVIWSLSPSQKIRASLAAASLSLVAALSLLVLSSVDHLRSIKPSFIINTYLLLTVPFDAAKVRTLWLRSSPPSLVGVTCAALTVKLLVLIVEAVEKRNILLPPYSESPSETTSGMYARGLFLWLNPIFWIGFRGIIREEDVFRADGDLASETLRANFSLRWSERRYIVIDHYTSGD
jgi:ATP-binding cassette subfamily C (CFTR/MRP) protein 1